MENSTYLELVLRNLDRDHEDLLTEKLFSLGAEGVTESLSFVQKDLRYDPEITTTEKLDLTAYFQPAIWNSEDVKLRYAELRTWLSQQDPETRIEVTEQPHVDWLAEWKKGFESFCFADPFWIVPAWLTAPAQLEPWQIIRIEPGMAFGTGTHETTQICARLLIEYARTRGDLRARPLSGLRVLDVGCGTGVLAIVASRLGAEIGIGLDIDPEARRTARENLELNAMSESQVRIDDRQLSEVAQEIKSGRVSGYDIVLANIIDGVLLQLARDLKSSLIARDHAVMIVSGVLNDRAPDFLTEFQASTGLKLRMGNKVSTSAGESGHHLQMGEWHGYIFFEG